MKMENGDKLDEKLSDVLSRAVLLDAESSFADRDAFQNWLEEGVQRQELVRRRKIRRIGLGAVAVFVCVCLLSGSFMLLTDILPPSLHALLGPGEGVAVPDPNQDITYENGSIVIGGDGNGNVGTWTATFASYEDIPEKYREQIVWFEDMPEGYELEQVAIKSGINYESYIISYYNEMGGSLRVKKIIEENPSESVTVLSNFDEEFYLNRTFVYKKFADSSVIYAYLQDKAIIYILDSGFIEQTKIEAMIASTKIGLNM